MKIGYFDCFAGAGGDMIVAAMLDAGLDADFLKKQLATLGIKDLKIKITQTKRAGLRAVQFIPESSDKQERKLEQIIEIIKASKIAEPAKKTAIKIFKRLAEAEAAVHGKEPNEIHFHEVGAVDSIADIVSAAIGLEALGIEKVFCSPLSIGGGSVECAHGLLPVPAPATAELIKGLPVVGGPAGEEMLTPTAAAIFSVVAEGFGHAPAMTIEAIGCGAGTRQFDDFSNVLRLIVGEYREMDKENADSVCLLEANIDDVSGEVIGASVDKLLNEGALDVFTEPIYMKKNRPAVKLSVLCELSDIERFEKIIFEQRLSFGIRKQILQRSKLSREFVTVETEFGEIRIKTGSIGGKVVYAKPEFSDCAASADKAGVAIKVVLEAAMAAYRKAVQK